MTPDLAALRAACDSAWAAYLAADRHYRIARWLPNALEDRDAAWAEHERAVAVSRDAALDAIPARRPVRDTESRTP